MKMMDVCKLLWIIPSILFVNCFGGFKQGSVDYCPVEASYDKLVKLSKGEGHGSIAMSEPVRIYDDVADNIKKHVQMGAEVLYQLDNDDLFSKSRFANNEILKKNWHFAARGSLLNLAENISQLNNQNFFEEKSEIAVTVIATLALSAVSVVVGLAIKAYKAHKEEQRKDKILEATYGDGRVLDPINLNGKVSLLENMMNGLSCAGLNIGNKNPEEAQAIRQRIEGINKVLIGQLSDSAKKVTPPQLLGLGESKDPGIPIFLENYNKIWHDGNMVEVSNPENPEEPVEEKRHTLIGFVKNVLQDTKLGDYLFNARNDIDTEIHQN